MSIKSNNLELERQVKNFESLTQSLLDLKNSIETYRTNYNGCMNSYNNLVSYYTSKDFDGGSPDAAVKQYLVSMYSYITALQPILSKCNITLSNTVNYIRDGAEDLYASGDLFYVLQKVLREINNKTKDYNVYINNIKKADLKSYTNIIRDVTTSKDFLTSAKQLCKNFEIVVNGKEKISKLRDRITETRKTLSEFNTFLNKKIIAELNSIKTIDITNI